LFGLSFQKCLPNKTDTKGLIRSCYPKKDIQHKCQKKRHKNTNNEPINLFYENIARKSFLSSFLFPTQYIIQFYGTLILISHCTKGSKSKNWLTRSPLDALFCTFSFLILVPVGINGRDLILLRFKIDTTFFVYCSC